MSLFSCRLEEVPVVTAIVSLVFLLRSHWAALSVLVSHLVYSNICCAFECKESRVFFSIPGKNKLHAYFLVSPWRAQAMLRTKVQTFIFCPDQSPRSYVWTLVAMHSRYAD